MASPGDHEMQADTARQGILAYFVRRVLWISVGVFLLGALTVLAMLQIAASEHRVADHLIPRLTATYRLTVDAAALGNLSLLLGQVETDAERRTMADRLTSRAETMDAMITNLETQGGEQHVVASVRRVRQDLMAGALSLNALVQEELSHRLPREGVIEQVRLDRLETLRDRKQNLTMRQQTVSAQLTTLVTALATELEHEIDEQQMRAERLAWALVAALVIGMAGGSLLLFILHRKFQERITHRLDGLRQAMVNWQADGRLTETPTENDEIGEMGRALWQLIEEVDSRTRMLEHLASTDVLTGLATRRHVLAVAEAQLSRARRFGQPMSVLLGDVDHFKHINDTHGHGCGDRVLIEIARAWREALREVDTVGRLGGEEFVAILPQTQPEAAVIVAERIRVAVSAIRVDCDGDAIATTISIGVAGTAETSTIDAVLADADDACYAAKHAGRNRVVAAS